MIVTPEAPVNTVNSEQVMIVTIASPPGIQPSIAFANRTRRSAVFASARM
jgi:hypothetical protein